MHMLGSAGHILSSRTSSSPNLTRQCVLLNGARGVAAAEEYAIPRKQSSVSPARRPPASILQASLSQWQTAVHLITRASVTGPGLTITNRHGKYSNLTKSAT